MSDGWTTFGAVELGRRIRDGQATSRQVVEAHIARIRATHGRLNALVLDRYGFKPTSGRLNPVGTIEDVIMPGQESILSQAGPLARRVEDLDAAMGAMLNDGVLGQAWKPRPLGEVRGLRAGVFEDNGVVAASPALRRAVREAAEALRERGAEVVPFESPDVHHGYRLYTRLMTADGLACLKRALRGSKTDNRILQLLFFVRAPSLLRLFMRLLAVVLGQRIGADSLRHSGPISADRYWQLIAERNRYRARFFEAMDRERLDVLVCPPLATVALRHGTAIDVSIGQSYACLFNLLGMPAGTVAATRVREGEEGDRTRTVDYAVRRLCALEQGSAGLPVGVQIAARPFQDELVVSVMAAAEAGLSGRDDYPARPPER